MDKKTNNENDNSLSLSKFKQFQENPFMANLIFPKGNKNVRIAKSDKGIFNKSTGEVDDNAMFIGTQLTVDKEQFVKIYHSQLQAIFDLSKAALKIFSYIASCTDYEDQIIFKLEECKRFTGYRGKEAIYKGLAELLNADMIARTDASNIYFINPQIFYKGDRIVLVTEYRKKKEKARSLDPNQAKLWDKSEE